MPLRKQMIQDASEILQLDENTQELESDEQDEFSSSNAPQKRRREREDKPKEMTEEEMMDMALRLSEQEASATALRLQQEEEAVLKAIHQSMAEHSQPDASSQSQSLLAVRSPRKLLHLNGRKLADRETSEDANAGLSLAGEENRNKKRKRKDSTQIFPQDSPRRSDSPQSSDSPPLDLRPRSPTFPSTGRPKAAVHLPRLRQDLLDTCRTSGFVLCSPDSLTQNPPPASPTFPGSPRSPPKSSVFSERGDAEEAELSQEFFQSPVFGVNTRRKASPALGAVSRETSGLASSSQESLSSSSSCRPGSPVFPGSSAVQPEGAVSSEAEPGCVDAHRMPAVPAAADEAGSDVTTSSSQGSSQCLRPVSEGVEEPQRNGDAGESEMTSDMMLLWSDEDEVATPTGSPSPVFPEDRPRAQASSRDLVAADSPQTSNCRRQRSTTEEEPRPIGSQQEVSSPTVHYYWGVPFCPRGLDPDAYTQVILAQMDVYDQSLKQAQRRLLRKAPWGEPILPQPQKSPSPESPAETLQDSPDHHLPGRRNLGLRRKQRRGAAEEEEEEEEEQTQEEEEGERTEGGEGEEEQVEAEDCDVCPETQLSGDDTQDLTAGAEPQLRAEIQDVPEVEMILQEDSPAVVEPSQEEEEEEEEMELDVVGKSEENAPVGGGGSDLMKMAEGAEPEVEEIKRRGLQRSSSPEVPSASVACPICQGSFPLTQIELHAAYCDGEAGPQADAHPASPKPRRKKPRRAEPTGESSNRNQEKCYICQKSVPLREFGRHTELCILGRPAHAAAKGNLLSALDQTETRGQEAGPSGSRVQLHEVIDLRDDEDDDDEEAVPAFRVSDSPIRSFTPISEASDCLVDFRKQPRARRPNLRRRRR